MAKLSIARKHHLSHRKAKEEAQKVAEDLKQRFELSYAWRGDDIEFQRPGLTGRMCVGKNEVRLDCELGILLSLLRSKLESEIDREFELRFGKSA